ncbi:Uncharacterised protein [Legionella pneumophila]|nr:Uncharacterised protein [Legionella pneumophila]
MFTTIDNNEGVVQTYWTEVRNKFEKQIPTFLNL